MGREQEGEGRGGEGKGVNGSINTVPSIPAYTPLD